MVHCCLVVNTQNICATGMKGKTKPEVYTHLYLIRDYSVHCLVF
jgi:hypothetical protein